MTNFSLVLFTIMSFVMAGKLVSSTNSSNFEPNDGFSAGIGGIDAQRREKRAAGDCKGGSGRYITYWNTDMGNLALADSVEECFRSLKITADRNNNDNMRWGCYHASSAAGCHCTFDSSYIFSLALTFSEARDNLRRDTSNFRSIEGERHEGNMYVSYTCPKSASTYPQILSDGRNCAGNRNPAESLRFRAGDVIFCRINKFKLAFHVMLATSDSTVAHVEGGSKVDSSANLREDRWTRILCDFDDCSVKSGDQFCYPDFNPYALSQDKCKYSVGESVQRARKDIKEMGTVYYDLYRCNCEHWVARWKTGLAISQQSFPAFWAGGAGSTNDQCPI